jgi:hypothetical protein
MCGRGHHLGISSIGELPPAIVSSSFSILPHLLACLRPLAGSLMPDYLSLANFWA